MSTGNLAVEQGFSHQGEMRFPAAVRQRERHNPGPKLAEEVKPLVLANGVADGVLRADGVVVETNKLAPASCTFERADE